MLITPFLKFPLSKEKQVGHFGKKAKRKERWKKLKPGRENQLLKDAIGYLEAAGIPYMRLLEDWQWDWIWHYGPKDLKEAFSELWGGIADIFVFKKLEACNWNKCLPVELKSEGRKPRKNQRKRAMEINTAVVTSIEEFKNIVEEFQK